jgi:hypothetical protein
MGSSVMLLASSVEDRGFISDASTHDLPHLNLAASLMNPRSSTLEASSITMLLASSAEDRGFISDAASLKCGRSWVHQ